jgi:hypothetical protein
MKPCCARLALVLCLAGTSIISSAQTSATTNTSSGALDSQSSVIPQFVKFAGTVSDLNGKPLTGIVGVTFALYKDQQGGAPLWLETQNVRADSNGHYSVMLGSTTAEGLPADVFSSGDARWLGVQPTGQPEQARVMLVSVPYALKAGDAQTLGGLPASAFMLSGPTAGAQTTAPAATTNGSSTPPPAPPVDVTTSGGGINTLPLFTTATNIQSSILSQAGAGAAGKIGINTAAPGATLDVNGTANVRGALTLPATGPAAAAAGKNSQPQDFIASVFNKTTSTAVPQKFQWQAQPANNNTANASGTLNLLYASGAAVPAQILSINSKGVLAFAPGQTFPGTGPGTITGITTATESGLTGGGNAGNLNLSIGSAGVTNAMLAHPSLTITAGTDLTGGGAILLGGITTLNLDTTKVPQLGAANTFVGNQTITGNLSLPNTTLGGKQGVISIGQAAIHNYGPSGSWNMFAGAHAGNFTTTGLYLTSFGTSALQLDTSGSYNTAMGASALMQTTTGSDNTALGMSAGFNNQTGSNNTFLGYSANAIGSLTNATAIGANAVVGENNAVVLGGTGSNAVSVGIGTTTPAWPLHVSGSGVAMAEFDNSAQTSRLRLNGKTGTGGDLIYQAGGTSLFGVYSIAANTLGFYPADGSTASMFINGSNVGIGTTTPNATLEVNGAGSFMNSVAGYSSTVGASAVFGNNSATSGGGTNGVSGYTSSPSGAGTVGVNTSSGGSGVYGESYGTSAGSAGVYGVAGSTSATGPTYGVYGTFSSNLADFGSAGVYGSNSDSGKTTFGVYGVNIGASHGTGVSGTGTTISSTGSSQVVLGTIGVWGDGVGSITGVLGTADVGTAMLAENNTGTTTDLPALEAINESTTTGAMAFEAGGGRGTQCTIDTGGDLTCSGSVSGAVTTASGRAVKVYGVASPENWFEDFGSGQLSTGSTHIALEPTFASTIATGEAYHVFLTPNGDCKGLYVASKSGSGFVVRELGGGASNVSFDYRIVAKRRGYEKVRMEDVTEPVNRMNQRIERLHPGTSSEHVMSAPQAPRTVAMTEPRGVQFSQQEKSHR